MTAAKPLAGVTAPLSTPFAADESVDLAALGDNMQHYAESGLHGFLALGSNGENRSLTEEERLAVLDVVVARKAPEQMVMAGATYDAQLLAERFLVAAADHGADYGLILAPSYFRKQMTPEILYRYYSTLADAAPLPLVLYNVPGVNGITLEPELVARLAPHPNIAGMKYSAPSGVETYLELQRPDFRILAGSANFLLTAMHAGSPGGTVSLANSFPQIALRLYELGASGDTAEGPRYQEYVARVNRAISGRYGVSGVKAAMDLAGLAGGLPRRPLLPLDAEARAEMRTTLQEEGLLA